jgi:hypothetical protein
MHPESPTLLWKRSRGATAVAPCRSHVHETARAGTHRKASLETSGTGQVRQDNVTNLTPGMLRTVAARDWLTAVGRANTTTHLVSFADLTCSKGDKASPVEHAARSCSDSRSSQRGDRRCASGFGQAFDRQSSVEHAVKPIRNLKSGPKIGLWTPKYTE